MLSNYIFKYKSTCNKFIFNVKVYTKTVPKYLDK